METSSRGIQLIKSFESLSLSSYLCPAGKLTIGYGHTGNVTPGMQVSVEEAEALLQQDLKHYETAVTQAVRVSLTQNQFDALVCFCFNVGVGNFQGSTLLRLVNQMDYVGAANEFDRWNHVNGKVSDGLTRRREAERALFLAQQPAGIATVSA